MKYILIYISIVLALFQSSCQPSSEEKSAAKIPTGRLSYDVLHPSKKFFMPDRLEEISGITYYQPNQLLCVQDEEGKVFLYNLEEKQVEHTVRFGKDGDYEDLAIIGKEVYVIKSNGVLHHFMWDTNTHDKAEDEQLPTPLHTDNDVEGLCFNPQTNQLWLAPKQNAGIETDTARGYAIYAYDLTTKQLNTTPVIHFYPDSLEPFLQGKAEHKKKKSVVFKPSAIAIHPIENRVYMLSANGRYLVVVNRDGTVFEAVSLPAKWFRQPEGLCFSPQGNLFIASEGDGQTGYILQFDYLKPTQ